MSKECLSTTQQQYPSTIQQYGRIRCYSIIYLVLNRIVDYLSVYIS
jgi:hypothetical protein